IHRYGKQPGLNRSRLLQQSLLWLQPCCCHPARPPQRRYQLRRSGNDDGAGFPRRCASRRNSIEIMIRIETMQGTLARRGFVDAVTAERIIDHWADEHEPLLDLLAKSADPDLALAGLDRLRDRVPDLLDRMTAAPVLARQLVMVLGGSSKLSLHLIAHPDHLRLLETELVKVPGASLRRGAWG